MYVDTSRVGAAISAQNSVEPPQSAQSTYTRGWERSPRTPSGLSLPSRKSSNRTPSHRRRRARENEFTQGPNELVSMLSSHLEAGNWGPMLHIMHLANFMAQCKPYLAKTLAQAGAPKVLIDVMKATLANQLNQEDTEVSMSEAAEMLLYLVETDQAACTPDILTADAVGVLLQALSSPDSGSQARQLIARLIHRIVSSGPAWRGPLLAHGGLESLPHALQDPLAACDVVFIQEVLWALAGLVDAAVAGGGDISNPQALCETLVPLLQLLLLPGHEHLSHVAALVIRVLHVLASGDDVSKQLMGKLGVPALLVKVIHEERQHELQTCNSALVTDHDVARAVETVGNAHGPDLATSTGAKHPSSASFSMPPDGRSQSSTSRPPLSMTLHRQHTHGRDVPEKGPLDGISAWDRTMAVLLLHAILIPGSKQANYSEAKQRMAALISYGLLLPVSVDNHTSSEQRLCVLKESVVALKNLVSDATDNQAQAVASGAVPVLVHLVATADVTMAWQAADTLSSLVSLAAVPELLEHNMVEEVTQLLQESADALHLMTVKKQLQDHAISGSAPALPTPHAAYAHRTRRQRAADRVQLVGKQRLSYPGSSCMYSTHDHYSMCDYCVPSACLRALLRLLSTCAQLTNASYQKPQPTEQNNTNKAASSRPATPNGVPESVGFQITAVQDGAGRFVDAGGLYALFLLLHHELSGVHHSKMASSLVSLLNMVLDAGLDVQDEVRKVGGLALLISLMESMARPQGVTDIYQLRVQVCMALARLLQGNTANKLLVRERGLIPLLTGMLQNAMDSSTSEVLDDKDQVIVCVLDLLAACIAGSQGNQEALVSAGGLRLLNNLLTQATTMPATSGMTRSKQQPRPLSATPVLASAVNTMACLVQGSNAAQLVVLGSPLLTTLVSMAEPNPTGSLAMSVVNLACTLMHSNAQGKPYAVASGVLGLLLKMLQTEPAGPHVAMACQGLHSMCVYDVDQQNEVVAQGGLHMVNVLLQNGGLYGVHALWLLCCLLHGNSYVKNAVRQQSRELPKRLVKVLQEQGLQHADLTVAAAHALAQLCQSNHANQELIAEEGGLEAVSELMRQLLQPAAAQPSAPVTPSTTPRPKPLNSFASVTVAPPGLEGLGNIVMYPAVLDALMRFMSSLLEFNSSNQTLARESGCLTLVVTVLLRVAEVREPGLFRRAGLLPGIAAACGVIACATQDCQENQAHLVTGHEDLAPALFCLLAIDEPYVAYDAARALEYMVIRSDMVHDQDESRAEFEADAIRTLINVLHTRGGPRGTGDASIFPTSSVAAMHAAFWAPGTSNSSQGSGVASAIAPPPLSKSLTSAAAAKEAATVLAAVVTVAKSAALAASNPSSGFGPAQGNSTTNAGKGSAQQSTPEKTAPALTPMSTFARLFSRRSATTTPIPASQPPTQPTATQNNSSLSGPTDSIGASSAPRRSSSINQPIHGSAAETGLSAARSASTSDAQQLPQPSDLAVADLRADHGSGLLHTSSFAQRTTMAHDDWMRLAGQSAATFQPVSALIAEGPWRPLKVELAWLLFLLAARSETNRHLVSQMERSVVAPVAAQLANAEAFFASAEAAAALELSDAQSSPSPLPVSVMAQESIQPTSSLRPTSSQVGDNTLPAPVPTSSSAGGGAVTPRVSETAAANSQFSQQQPVNTLRTSNNGVSDNGVAQRMDGLQVPGAAALPGSSAASPRMSASGMGVPAGLPKAVSNRAPAVSDDDDDLELIRQEAEMLAGAGV